ncbi:hypothetical protein DL96DRAFT_1615081 [Flagelloscypha sp. PMI_526]|nr:hypothetical protein DL96DRAFT_1615081 [Flagelloscypha sp. PMI_526]
MLLPLCPRCWQFLLCGPVRSCQNLSPHILNYLVTNACVLKHLGWPEPSEGQRSGGMGRSGSGTESSRSTMALEYPHMRSAILTAHGLACSSPFGGWPAAYGSILWIFTYEI